MIGYVGGSITWLAVRGATELGHPGFWPYYDVGGGTLPHWLEKRHFLRDYRAMCVTRVPDKLWWELVFKDIELKNYPTHEQRFDLAVDVLELLRRRTDAPIYASALAAYAPDAPCSAITVNPPLVATLVADLVHAGLVLAGPVMPALTADQVIAGKPDACHQNEIGRAAHGQVLIDFFDR